MSNVNEPDRVNTGALATTTGIVGCAVLGIALFVTSLVRDETKALGNERQGTQERSVRELRADQLSVLEGSPTWKDRAKGVVTLPIDRAMDSTVEAVRKNPKALSPWHRPKAEAMGGAGPEEASGPAGSGGATSAAPGTEEPADAKSGPAAPGAPAPAPATAATPAAPAPVPASP